MRKPKVKLKKVLIPSDFIAIIVILVGLVIAIFLSDIAVRLIGMSVAILGSVALFMQISQRISDMVSIRHMPKTPAKNYKVTKKKDQTAVRTVIEDFDGDFDPEEDMGSVEGFGAEDTDIKKPEPDIPKSINVKRPKEIRYKKEPVKQEPEPVSIPEKKEQAYKPVDFMDADEGFHIVNKPEKIAFKSEEDIEEEKDKEETQLEKTDEKPEKITEDLPDEIKTEKGEQQKTKSPYDEQQEKYSEKLSEPGFNVTEDEKGEFQDEQKEKLFDVLDEKEEYFNNPKKIKKPEITVKRETTEEEKTPEPVIEEKDINKTITEIKPQTIEKPQEVTEKEKVDDDTTEVNKEIQAPKKPETEKFKKKSIDEQLSALTEDVAPIMGRHPRKEFEYYLNRILKSIRAASNTRTAAFILVNAEKQNLILEYFATDVPKYIRPDKKFPLSNDVISQIFINAKPEILEEINPSAELDLIPYYTRPVHTQSFIGIPVFYQGSVIGILCCDSNTAHVYDDVTVDFLGHLTKLISGLLLSYTDKYDLLQESRIFEAVQKLKNLVESGADSLSDIRSSVIMSLSKLTDNTTVGICTYEEKLNGWYLFERINPDKAYYKKPIPADVGNSFIGDTIRSGETTFITPVTGKGVRVYQGEDNITGGFFLSVAIPLKTMGSNFGAVFIEGSGKPALSDYDITLIETLCEYAGSIIEKMHFIDMLHSNAMIDDVTGVLNPPAFYTRLEEEFERDIERKDLFTLCLFQIDRYAAYDPDKYRDRMEHVRYHVIGIVNKFIRKFDIFGKADMNTYGVILPGMTLDKCKFWAERLRQEIAISILELEQSRFNVTISMGLTGMESASDPDSLIANARQMLDRSLEKTNYISIYS